MEFGNGELGEQRRLANILEDNQPAIAGHQNENDRNDVPLNELGFTGRTARSRPTGMSAANRTSHVAIPATIFWITS
jgi:hypothetical protein